MKISDLPPGSAVLVPAEWLAERVGEETPNGSDEKQATIEMWVRRCTKNYTGPGKWLNSGDGAPESAA